MLLFPTDSNVALTGRPPPPTVDCAVCSFFFFPHCAARLRGYLQRSRNGAAGQSTCVPPLPTPLPFLVPLLRRHVNCPNLHFPSTLQRQAQRCGALLHIKRTAEKDMCERTRSQHEWSRMKKKKRRGSGAGNCSFSTLWGTHEAFDCEFMGECASGVSELVHASRDGASRAERRFSCRPRNGETRRWSMGRLPLHPQ